LDFLIKNLLILFLLTTALPENFSKEKTEKKKAKDYAMPISGGVL
jgi:hypothetical protein